ncbi:DUF4349 domain-containing protein [Reichenbachiella sp. MALMAid0571]|uniref:DUF4349 domain-containing protein n=1 Tax=Reichenbachiella sp. MALMAid0571 TaxID=3143939 RepID=UPI0032DEE6FD
MQKTLIILFSFLVLSGCYHNENAEQNLAMDEASYGGRMAAPEVRQAKMMSQEQQAPAKKIIKTGNLTLKVESTKETYQEILSMLEKSDAYIENENQSTQSDRINYNLTIRVNKQNFDELFNSLSTQSERVENRSINVEDVSERYYDLDTRIKNQQALEQRYVKLLEKTTSIKEILEIERNLNEIRTEIEIKQGQFNYLSKKVEYSTIYVNFYEVLPYTYDSEARPGFVARIKKSISDGWQGFLSVLIGTIGLWPFILAFVVIVYAVRKWRKRQS